MMSSSSQNTKSSNATEDDILDGTTPLQHQQHVVVVGSGFAGLSATYHLMKEFLHRQQQRHGRRKHHHGGTRRRPSKLHVTMIEARDRIGGRVYPYDMTASTTTTKSATAVGPVIIDLGGQWLHEASNKNPIRIFMEEHGLKFYNNDNSNKNNIYNDEDDYDDSERNNSSGSSSSSSSSSSNPKRRTNVVYDGIKVAAAGAHPHQSSSSLLSHYHHDHDHLTKLSECEIDRGIFQRASKIFYKAVNEYEIDDVSSKTTFQDLLDERLDMELKSDTRLSKMLFQNNNTMTNTSPSPTSTTELSSQQQQSATIDHKATTHIANGQQQQFQQSLNYLIHRMEGYEGGHFDDIGAKMGDVYENLGGPDEIPHGSYQTVMDKIKEEIHRMVSTSSSTVTFDLLLNTEVKRIEYDPDPDRSFTASTFPATTTTTGNKGRPTKAKIICKSNTTATASTTTYECDVCICTVPLGVLQNNCIEFSPPLPSKRIDSINKIGFGLLDKIVLQFPPTNRKFYPDNLEQFAICHPDPSLIKSFYDFTDEYGQLTGTNTNIGDEHDKKFTPVLIQFLAGKAADRIDCINSPFSDDEVVAEALDSLRLLFGRNNVPDPIATKVTRWRTDPYALGAYSFTKVGCSAKDFDEIGSPIGNLFWAGEHTSKHHHSTVHGAWKTGQTAARQINDEW